MRFTGPSLSNQFPEQSILLRHAPRRLAQQRFFPADAEERLRTGSVRDRVCGASARILSFAAMHRPASMRASHSYFRAVARKEYALLAVGPFPFGIVFGLDVVTFSSFSVFLMVVEHLHYKKYSIMINFTNLFSTSAAISALGDNVGDRNRVTG